jgi:hypothetical protein
MLKCNICGDEVEEVYECEECKEVFCDKCGDPAELLCEYCLEEEL